MIAFKCAVPVAGITHLRDHVVNGCVEGHCDCMYMVNTFRWDYAKVAALVAPRPLLISNTDKDTIFPLEGVIDVHRQVRHIYELYGAGEKSRPADHRRAARRHSGTAHPCVSLVQSLPETRQSMIEKTAVKFFEPEQLKVFAQLPTDEINTTIDETLCRQLNCPRRGRSSKIKLPGSTADSLDLRERCFRAWPDNDPDWKPVTEIKQESLSMA